MKHSNEAVLEALRHAQYRQVPWPKRPKVFEFLRGAGLLETIRQRTPDGPGYHAPVDIAVLTARGKAEIVRLERSERAPTWSNERVNLYLAPEDAIKASGN
ncbi:hypothetical protein [Pararobbsia silviterrae]|uniref:Uncharacterized protein n=1 Tax=Pararobbsia silviterrae TaxID=1792498 RepID=A0A494XNE0_9BURK|nr:hypothetical protein [Pararobbsia silviterrae]RKP50236.1 hypothetical protein D7S86_19095 [Pararobbsia silviterrae]